MGKFVAKREHRGVEATGVYAPELEAPDRPSRLKVAQTQKSAVNKAGHQRRVEMEAASPSNIVYPEPRGQNLHTFFDRPPPRDPKGKVCPTLCQKSGREDGVGA